jgi:hypothetical protein
MTDNDLVARELVREYDRAYRELNRERIRENHRRFRESNPDYYRNYKSPLNLKTKASKALSEREWTKRNPEKHKAQQVVNRAIRNREISREPCEVCGVSGKLASGQSAVHAHHDDYLKPLEVRWLCPKHHSEYHRHLRDRRKG